MVISLNIIWIDENIDNEENIQYRKELESIGLLINKLFKGIDEAINHMKSIKFQETIVIISDRLYSEFVEKFKENIKDMCVAPKIIVFTKNKDNFKNNKEYKNNISLFYKFGGIAITLDEIKKFIKNEIISQEMEKSDEIQLTFEYIDSIEKLELPLFFKTLIDNVSNDNMEEVTNSLYNNYSKDKNELKKLLGSIKSMRDIPIEILSKYYARLYTIESNFYKDINKDLGLNKREKYLSFIKTLYEGVKLKSLSLASNNILYRGSKISNEEVEKIKSYLNKKKENLPGSIVFSRSFLSFSKEKNVTEKFLKKANKNNNLSKVLYILEKDDNIGYNLSTHGDIETISYYPNEKEVLFFPFSSFEIKEIKETKIGEEKRYEIKLLYLGKYLKEIENNENIINNENKIPVSEFKNQLSEFGLVKTEKIENINTKTLYSEYKKYEKDLEENNNKITSEINISSNDINKDIQIINSFENYKRMHIYIINKKDDDKYTNEEEIKENIEIKINGEKFEFAYFNKFNKKGKNKIEYLFKNKLTKTNHMFFGCKSLTNLNLSNFNSENVTNMSYMFSDCNSLTNLNLSNFNTQNVTNMSDMFYNCNSLTNLNLSNFNTQNVINMSGMFYNCNSLTKLNLSNFNTQNVTNMSNMFRYCNSLTKLNISNFNTQNVTNMVFMFYDCKSLKSLNLSNFNTQNVTNLSYMFYNCNSLTNLNISNFNTQNVTNMNYLFYECNSLINLDLSNFNTQNVTNMSYMFRYCNSLTNLDLSNFNTQKVTNMIFMFFGCKSLTNLNISNFNTQNVTSMRYMFSGCNSLVKENIITNDNKIKTYLKL